MARGWTGSAGLAHVEGRDRGGVTVEIAIATPVLVVVTAFALWAASLGATYVRALDTAQTAARQASRGQDPGPLPDGMVLQLYPEAGAIRAVVTAEQASDLPVLAGFGATVRADATAAYEPYDGEPAAP